MQGGQERAGIRLGPCHRQQQGFPLQRYLISACPMGSRSEDTFSTYQTLTSKLPQPLTFATPTFHSPNSTHRPSTSQHLNLLHSAKYHGNLPWYLLALTSHKHTKQACLILPQHLLPLQHPRRNNVTPQFPLLL